MTTQLPLIFEYKTTQTFEAFYPGSNEEIVDHLKNFYQREELLIYLWGETGAGKTHLLQAMIQQANKIKLTTFYVSLDQNSLPNPKLLEGIESFDLVCFDNIDQIAGNSEWETAFFNFFNLQRDTNKQLVLSASCPPKFLAIQLPDLKTRMNWGLTLKLQRLTDNQQLHALIYKANERGLEISDKVGKYLITHYVRDLASVWELLDKVDHATLVAQRKLTIPFLKQIMSNQNETG